MNLLCWNMAPNTRVTRKWEVFAGRNKFYCDGYLMSAPNTGVFYFTVFLITLTSGLFFAFDCPYLTIRITPAIPVIGGLLYLFTMSSLLRTTFTDPGVIPRASQDEAAYIEKQIEVPNSLNSPTFRPPPRTKEVLVKGQTIKLKYCFTCKIFRPPRASHCSLCDNCVDRFDHHCPWVGNCVGKRNYRFFYMFIVSLAFLAVFIFSCSLTHLILLGKDGIDEEFIDIIRQSPFSVVVTLICFLSIWSVIGLAGFHTYLTTSDQTTNEDIKGSFSSKGAQHSVNPYSHGNICMNCFYILCGPMTPSLIDRRGIVTDEYRVQMQQPERYSISQPIHNPPTGQPVTTEEINKMHYYDIEAGPTLMSSGVYRQRSYDNLQNGNSNSVAHLVENELPISTLHSPINTTTTSAINTTAASVGLLAAANGGGGTSSATNMSASSQSINIGGINPFDVLDNNNNGNDDDGDNGGDDNDEDNITGNSGDMNNATLDEDDDNDENDVHNDNMENLSNRNNLSDSYSNLFRDKIDDDDIANNQLMKLRLEQLQQHRENVYSNIPHNMTSSSAALMGIGGGSKMVPTSISQSILNNVDQTLISNSSSSSSDKSDPNLHVYSNVIMQRQQAQMTSTPSIMNNGSNGNLHQSTPTTTTTSTTIKTSFGTIGASTTVAHLVGVTGGNGGNNDDKHKMILSSSTTSSKYLVDDLDLDDPVIVAASFGQTPKKTKLHQQNGGGLLSSSSSTSLSAAAAAAATTVPTSAIKMSKSISMEMKNVIPQIILDTSNANTTNTNTIITNTTTNNTGSGGGGGEINFINSSNNNSSSSNVFCSPSRMRLLHDTTMIDTALDLDSLDGSSIGNNSQACLVKTANV